MKICFLISLFFAASLFAQGEWVNFNITNSGLPVNAIHTMAIDNEGIKWIGTWGGGLVRFDGTTWTVFDTTNSELPHNTIYSIAIDKENNKWIGTFGGGLAKFDGKSWTIFDKNNSPLTDNTIYSLEFDGDENLYIGTWGKAFLKFDKKDSWTSYNITDLPFYNFKIPGILHDRADNIWIGSALGLYKLSGDSITSYQDINNKFSQSVYSMAEGKDGTIWIGFKAGGLARIRGNEFTFYTSFNSPLPSDAVYDLAIDNNDILWVSTFGTGLVKYDSADWIVYSKTNSPLTDDFIFSVTPAPNGEIWVCTLNGGLFLITEE